MTGIHTPNPDGWGRNLSPVSEWQSAAREAVPTNTRAAHGGFASAAAASSPYNLPFLIVLGYLAIEFGRPQNWVSAISLLRPGAVLTIAGMIALVGSGRLAVPAVGRWMVAFLAVMIGGIPFAANQFYAFNHTETFAFGLFGAIFPVMMFVDSYRQVELFFRWWLALHVLLASYGMTHSGRGMGSFLGDENDFCLAMNVVLPYALFLFPVARTWFGRLLLLGGVGVYLAANVASFSRGGFVGLVAVGIGYWLRSSRKLASALTVIMFVGSMAVLIPDRYWAEIKTIQTADDVGDTGHKRLYYWGIGWQIFLDNPIMGVGPRNFEFTSYRYETEEEVARGHHAWGKAAHSLYFTLLPELGLLGVTTFGMTLVTAWQLRRGIGKKYRQLARTRSGALTPQLKTLYALTQAADVSLLAYLATGAFLSVLYYPHFWMNGALSVVLRRVFDQELERCGATASRPRPDRIMERSPRWAAASAVGQRLPVSR